MELKNVARLLAPFFLLLTGAGAPQSATLAPPPSRLPAAHVAIAPYRYDDVLFENDRIAHRIYGRALEAAEPPSGSGIDVWGKSVPWPFMERQLHTNDQHADHGEGLDFYEVGQSRGDGGLGIWFDNKLWTSRNYRTVRMLRDGPGTADFEVSYAPWPVDVVRSVTETRRFQLPLGTNFTRMISTINSNRPGELLIGIGLGKHATGPGPEQVIKDAARGYLIVWSAPSVHGAIGTAILFDPLSLVRITEDSLNYLVILRERPGAPFVYYSGAAWDRKPEFARHQDWLSYVQTQRPDFNPAH